MRTYGTGIKEGREDKNSGSLGEDSVRRKY